MQFIAILPVSFSSIFSVVIFFSNNFGLYRDCMTSIRPLKSGQSKDVVFLLSATSWLMDLLHHEITVLYLRRQIVSSLQFLWPPFLTTFFLSYPFLHLLSLLCFILLLFLPFVLHSYLSSFFVFSFSHYFCSLSVSHLFPLAGQLFKTYSIIAASSMLTFFNLSFSFHRLFVQSRGSFAPKRHERGGR